MAPGKYVDVNALNKPNIPGVPKAPLSDRKARKNAMETGSTAIRKPVDEVESKPAVPLEKVTQKDLGEDTDATSRALKRRSIKSDPMQPRSTRLKAYLFNKSIRSCPVCGVSHSSDIERCHKCDVMLIDEKKERFTKNKIKKMMGTFFFGFIVIGLMPCFVYFIIHEELQRPKVKHESDQWHFDKPTNCLIYRIDHWSMWSSLSGMAEKNGRCPPEKRFEYERYRFMDVEPLNGNNYCPASNDKSGQRRRCSFYQNKCPEGYKSSEQRNAIKSGCYRLWNRYQVKTWSKAVKHCSDFEASVKVASITNDDELRSLRDIVLSSEKRRWVWLGLTVAGLGEAQWETGEKLDYLPSWSIPLIPLNGACMQLLLSYNNAEEEIRQVPCHNNSPPAYVACKIVPRPVEPEK